MLLNQNIIMTCSMFFCLPLAAEARADGDVKAGSFALDVGYVNGNDVTSHTNPSAIIIDNKIHVFFMGSNRHLMRRVWDGNAWGPEIDFGGVLGSSPSALLVGNEVHVYYKGQDPDLFLRRIQGDQSIGGEVRLNGKLGSSPSAVLVGDEVHVFYRGVDPNMMRRRVTKTGEILNPEVPYGGRLGSSPSAILVGDEVHVYYRGEGPHLIRRRIRKDGSRVEPEDGYGGILGSGPGVLKTDNEQFAFYAGQDTGMYRRIVGGAEGKIGGGLSSNPTVVRFSNKDIHLFYRGKDGTLYHRSLLHDGQSKEERVGSRIGVLRFRIERGIGFPDFKFNVTIPFK
jgi:hypothetical protein